MRMDARAQRCSKHCTTAPMRSCCRTRALCASALQASALQASAPSHDNAEAGAILRDMLQASRTCSSDRDEFMHAIKTCHTALIFGSTLCLFPAFLSYPASRSSSFTYAQIGLDILPSALCGTTPSSRQLAQRSVSVGGDGEWAMVAAITSSLASLLSCHTTGGT